MLKLRIHVLSYSYCRIMGNISVITVHMKQTLSLIQVNVFSKLTTKANSGLYSISSTQKWQHCADTLVWLPSIWLVYNHTSHTTWRKYEKLGPNCRYDFRCSCLFVRIEIINNELREGLMMLDAVFLLARVLLSCSVLNIGSRAALPQGLALAGVRVSLGFFHAFF